MTDSNTKVYVVLGESGEYSDRNVWVSAVYLDRAKAEAAMLERLAAHRTWEQWDLRRRVALESTPRLGRRPSPLDGKFYSSFHTHEQLQEFERLAGPKPEHEPAERLSLHEGVLGYWGTDAASLTEILAFDEKDIAP